MMKTTLASLAAVLAVAGLSGCATTPGGYGPAHMPPSIAAAAQSLPTTADDRVMYLQLIQKMQKQGLYYASLAHIDAYRQRYGTTPELQVLHAEALRQIHQPAAAAKLYQALTNGPQAAAAWHGLGLIAAGAGHFDQAVADLAHAVQLAPINADYLSDLGYAHLWAGQNAQAREPLAKAAELAPHDTQAIANLALLLMVQGNAQRADSMMDQAKLPAATQNAVRQQAVELLRRNRQTAQAGQPANSPLSRTSSDPTPGTAPQVERHYGIPANLLDRFATSPAAGDPSHAQP